MLWRLAGTKKRAQSRLYLRLVHRPSANYTSTSTTYHISFNKRQYVLHKLQKHRKLVDLPLNTEHASICLSNPGLAICSIEIT